MRALWLPVAIGLLTVPVLAGCIGDDSPSGDPVIDPPAPTIPEVPTLDGAAIMAHVEDFANSFPKRNANNEYHNGARDYLASAMEEAGLEVLRQTFTAPVSPGSTPSNIVTNDGTLQNVIGIKWGRDRDDWIVIGGHYDVTDGAIYGAYDNGAGTIITLELAKAFAGLETERTIAFTMFDGEEQGLRGSTYMVGSLLASGNNTTAPPGWEGQSFSDEFGYDPQVVAMVDIDMFGINYPAEPPIYFDDNSDVLRAFVDASRQEIGVPDDKIRYTGISAGRSDYAPFQDDLGVPVAFFISAFEEYYVGPVAMPDCQQIGPRNQCFTYPFWHRADTVETMELMAGGRDLLDAGFDTAGRLSAELLHFLATEPVLELDIRE